MFSFKLTVIAIVVKKYTVFGLLQYWTDINFLDIILGVPVSRFRFAIDDECKCSMLRFAIEL